MLSKREFLAGAGAAALGSWPLAHAAQGESNTESVVGQTLDLNGLLA